jgi:cell division protein FtsB
MNALKYLIPLWVAIVVYAGLSLFSGAMGFSAYTELQTERDKQLANLETLKQLNQKLEGDVKALLSDSDTIAVYARELGYGSEDERFVRLVGLGQNRRRYQSAGQTVDAEEPGFVSGETIRLIALGSGLGTLGLVLMIQLLRFRREPGKTV